MCCKTIADVDDGFGDRAPTSREYTRHRVDSDSKIYAAIPGRNTIGLVLQVHMIQILGTHGIEIQIPSTLWCAEGRIAKWISYINYLWKDLLQKKVSLVLQKWSNVASRKLQHIYEGSNKMRFQCCMNSIKKLVENSCHSRTHWWESESA